VTREFFIASNNKGARQEEAGYYVSLHGMHRPPGEPRAPAGHGVFGGLAGGGDGGADAGAAAEGGPATSSTPPPPDAAAGGGGEEGEDSEQERSGKRPRRSGSAGSPQTGGGHRAAAAIAAAAVPAHVRVPPPEEVCLPGQAWGEGGRWIEEWDEAAALESRKMLLDHWHQWGRM
jgi:hypothetical protein